MLSGVEVWYDPNLEGFIIIVFISYIISTHFRSTPQDIKLKSTNKQTDITEDIKKQIENLSCIYIIEIKPSQRTGMAQWYRKRFTSCKSQIRTPSGAFLCVNHFISQNSEEIHHASPERVRRCYIVFEVLSLRHISTHCLPLKEVLSWNPRNRNIIGRLCYGVILPKSSIKYCTSCSFWHYLSTKNMQYQNNVSKVVRKLGVFILILTHIRPYYFGTTLLVYQLQHIRD